MEFTITSRELKDYILALEIVKYRKPLLSVDEDLKLYPEIVKVCELLNQAKDGQAKPYRGQRKVRFNIPEVLQTKNLNKALRYGLEEAMYFDHPKRGTTLLDKAYVIAIAGTLAPIPKEKENK